MRIPYVATALAMSFSLKPYAKQSTETCDEMDPVGVDERWEVSGSSTTI